MKRLPLLGFILALASCDASIDNSDQGVACYDTGSGMKCVPVGELPAGAKAECTDTDGEIETSQSSASGVSLSDNDTSESSDAPGVLPTGGGEDSDSGEDMSGNSESSSSNNCPGGGKMTDGHDSNSGEDTDGDGNSDSSSDEDGDGTDDSQDCDCVDPDGPPTGDGGPIIN